MKKSGNHVIVYSRIQLFKIFGEYKYSNPVNVFRKSSRNIVRLDLNGKW